MDTDEAALVVSGFSLLLAAVAIAYTRHQTKIAAAALELTTRIERGRGTLKSVTLRRHPLRRRFVVAELASGDSGVTVAEVRFTVILRRPPRRVLGYPISSIDRFYFMPPSSAWVFFEDGAPSFP
ncbi:MAG: hypothetical protein ACRCYU_01770, partial [Nocardioides sp.]